METRIQAGGSYGDKTPLPSPPPRGGSIETEILFNTEIEKTILASILFREHSDFFLLSEIVRPEFFYDKQMAKLYGVLKKRFEQQKPMTDFEMVARDMQEAGEKDFTVIDIVRLTENNPLVMDMEEYAQALKDLYQRRQLRYSLITLLEKVNDRTQNLVQTLQQSVKQLLSDDILSTKNTLNITEVLAKLRETIQNNFEQKIQQGLLTGFERLDRFGGLHRNDLVLIGADSSQGKTSLGINILMNAVRLSGAKALIFSLEMSALQIGARILSPETGIPASVLMYRQLTDEGMKLAEEKLQQMLPLQDNIFFGDSTLQTVDDMLQSIRLHHLRYGTNLVLIDYLQIISMPQTRRGETSREQSLAQAARQFKNIALELGITVVLLSQLNRDTMTAGNPEPTVSRIRGSGEVNEAADMTMLIYRPEVYNKNYPPPFEEQSTKGTAMLKIVKDRNGGYGGLGAFIVRFDGGTTRFY